MGCGEAEGEHVWGGVSFMTFGWEGGFELTGEPFCSFVDFGGDEVLGYHVAF